MVMDMTMLMYLVLVE